MSTEKYAFSHPVLFVFDMGNAEVVVPEIDDDFQVSGTSSCIAIRVMPDTDGEVALKLESQLSQSVKQGAIEVYFGQLDSPSGAVSISSAEMDEVLRLEFGKQVSSVRVFVDELVHPGKVWVEAN
ncbi:hypothetical protein [Serratia ureilytica]|uniref:hypothetical protein n=1 Tax=Serratia ureilytica TaxID=300181 RepID=UPI001D184637|nr:hypothetical protein [Serratia ureilytica]MCC4104754.1 hypothetical protein [Serratia ureilytica]